MDFAQGFTVKHLQWKCPLVQFKWSTLAWNGAILTQCGISFQTSLLFEFNFYLRTSWAGLWSSVGQSWPWNHTLPMCGLKGPRIESSKTECMLLSLSLLHPPARYIHVKWKLLKICTCTLNRKHLFRVKFAHTEEFFPSYGQKLTPIFTQWWSAQE